MVTSVILLAGGVGSRMGAEIPKQFLQVLGKPIVNYSFELFLAMEEVDEIVVVCGQEYRSYFEQASPKRIAFAQPGVRRQDSMQNGLREISNTAHLVCVHDAARPCVTEAQVQSVLAAAQEEGAAVLGMPIKSTVKEVDRNGFVIRTLDRSHVWEMQTPQVATPTLLRGGLEVAAEQGLTVTDDMALVELLDSPVKVVEGSYDNLKVTTPEDLDVVKGILSAVKVRLSIG
jgi:2-C-methyl-D-erythritol 4-phosphate cytidylyltransferase